MRPPRKAARRTSPAHRAPLRPSRSLRLRLASFTLIELLTVIAVIAILAAIVLVAAGYVQNKGAQSRALSEVQAMENACEQYKADNGAYPRASGTGNSVTDTLYAKTMGDPASAYATNYQAASLYLYTALTGDTNGYGIATVSYFPIKPAMCSRPNTSLAISSTNAVQYLMDPWGNSYGYSTAGEVSGTTAAITGYNPTFDLWSTGGTITTGSAPSSTTYQWIKNW